jgi:hypothetical protein
MVCNDKILSIQQWHTPFFGVNPEDSNEDKWRGCCCQTVTDGAKAEICRVPASMVLQSNPKVGLITTRVSLWDEVDSKGSPPKRTFVYCSARQLQPAGDPCPDSSHPMRFDTGRPHSDSYSLPISRSRTVGLEERQELSWRSTTSYSASK